jgi:HK97 family phage portal protein
MPLHRLFDNKISLSFSKHRQPTKQTRGNTAKSFLQTPMEPTWMRRDYQQFAEEAYRRNVIAHRSISLISRTAASVNWQLSQRHRGKKTILEDHALLTLLHKPNLLMGGAELFESLYSYRLISGNAYLHAVAPGNEAPQELYVLRPDRVSLILDADGFPRAYRYQVGETTRDYLIDPYQGHSPLLHLRYFHPLDDWYGLSPIEAAAYSIDQHNQAAIWNQALLQNGARPSGALTLQPGPDGMPPMLTESQRQELKRAMDEAFSGSKNAGRPLLLEGGLAWQEMGMTNKDMDFIEAKNSAARDIALAFGVPPQLLGIPGDNTYSNMQEARLAFWEDTVLPLLDTVTDALNNWLVPRYGDNLTLYYCRDSISALTPRRDGTWQRATQADFMTINEKRAAVGLSPLPGHDTL